MITIKHALAVAAFALAIPMASTVPGNAAPLAPATALSTQHTMSANPLTTEVRWRGGGGWRGGYRGGWGYRGAGIGLGLATGALIGGAIAAGSGPYYYGGGPGYYYGGGPAYYPGPAAVAAPDGDAEAYCMRRYRSYDPASGTYLNNDGNRYPCP